MVKVVCEHFTMLKVKSNIKSRDSWVCLCINPRNKTVIIQVSNKMDHKFNICVTYLVKKRRISLTE